MAELFCSPDLYPDLSVHGTCHLHSPEQKCKSGHLEETGGEQVSKGSVVFRAPEYREALLVQECAACKISIRACTSVSDNEQGSSVLPELFLCPKQTEPLL